MFHPVLGQGTVTLPGVQTGPMVPANTALLPKARTATAVFFKFNMLISTFYYYFRSLPILNVSNGTHIRSIPRAYLAQLSNRTLIKSTVLIKFIKMIAN